ncbi:MAG: folate-binding protein [Varibaculum cambriense]|uniref:CAF17-like 4Fe-4S cluster assembly/insertion protein YgfZ n=1 Tax=Varibaculum cambriense TaxID=184870 RepID=UPI002901E7A9|nr:folate-binding protein [Varibaculum cambriense]MDU2312484.1 folate-binding protein [Varibaculum cambriense]MDU4944007.1 folate-binding protein [Varibaculum cambriense]
MTFVDNQVALRCGYGIAETGLQVISVSGPDAPSWLTTLSSQVITGMSAGESREMLFLDANGRVRFAAGIVWADQVAWLFTADALALAQFLESMKFMSRVEIALRAELAVWGFFVPSLAEEVLAEFGPIWTDPWPGITAGGTAYSPRAVAHPGRDYPACLGVVPVEKTAAVRAELLAGWNQLSWPAETEDGYRLVAPVFAAEADWRALRIAAWRPYGSDVDPRALPHELDWLRTAVHLNKGCYCGQETVARIVNLGHPPRRAVFLHLDGSSSLLPPAGAELFSGSRKVGSVRVSANHFEDGPIALGLIKRTTSAENLTVCWQEDGEEHSLAAAVTPIGDPSGVSWQGQSRIDRKSFSEASLPGGSGSLNIAG